MNHLRTGLIAASIVYSLGGGLFAAPTFHYTLEGPGMIEGDPGEKVKFEVGVKIATEGLQVGDPEVEAWSMGIRAWGCTVLKELRAGTESDDTLNPIDFRHYEAVPGGLVFSVVLGKETPRTLDAAKNPHLVLKLEMEGTIPAFGCAQSLILFEDGLQGSGRPVKNIVTHQQKSYLPSLGRLSLQRCPGVCLRERTLFVSGPPLHFPAAAFSAQNRRACYSFRAPLGKPVILTLQDPNAANCNALFIRWGQAPSPTEFDQAVDACSTSGQRLIIPAARAGTCYVLVENQLLAGDSSIHLFAELGGACILEGMSTRRARKRVTRATVWGAGFNDETTSFALVPAAGGDSITAPPEAVRVISPEIAEAQFDLSLAAAGTYHLELPGAGCRLDNALEVVEALLEDQLQVEIIAQKRYRLDRLARLTVKYRNVGGEPLIAPILKIAAPPKTTLRLESDGEFQGEELQVLLAGNGGGAASLAPGEEGEIPVILQPMEGASVNVEVEFGFDLLTANATDGIGWASQPTPAGMSDGDWSASRLKLSGQLGETWHQYQAGLAALAGRLSPRDDDVRSLIRLWRFAVREALGRPSAAITGMLREAESLNPIPDLTMAAVQGDSIRACTKTGAQGQFVLECLERGAAYRIEAEGRDLGGISLTIPQGDDLLGQVLDVPTGSGPFTPGDKCLPCDGGGLPRTTLRPPDELFSRVATLKTKFVVPIDPNEKDSDEEDDPVAGEKKLVGIGREILFTIYFENLATAGAPAQVVVVEDRLDPNLDWKSVRFRDMKWTNEHLLTLDNLFGAAQTLAPDGGNRHGYNLSTEKIVPLHWGEFNGEILVDLKAGIDLQTGVITWRFETLDPVKRTPPDHHDAGFLVPNTDGFSGQGYVSFSVKLKDGVGDGVVVGNQASIVFDRNPPIATQLIERQVIITPEAPRDPVPPSDTAHPVDPGMRLSWGHSTRANRFDLYLWKKGESRPAEPTTVDLLINGYYPQGLADDTEYCWVVVAKSTRTDVKTEGPKWTFRVRKATVPGAFRRGDADGSRALDLTDPIGVLNFLFLSGAAPTCRDSADGDDSGVIDLTDAIYLLNFLFLGGPAPPAPGPEKCGQDPTGDEGGTDLGCAASCE